MNFIVAYKRSLPDNNWYADDSFATLDEAGKRFDDLAEKREFPEGSRKRKCMVAVRTVAIFPGHLWNFGLPTCKPQRLIDYTDKSDWPITAAASGLINSLNSDEL